MTIEVAIKLNQRRASGPSGLSAVFEEESTDENQL